MEVPNVRIPLVPSHVCVPMGIPLTNLAVCVLSSSGLFVCLIDLGFRPKELSYGYSFNGNLAGPKGCFAYPIGVMRSNI